MTADLAPESQALIRPADLSPESQALLAEVMRDRRCKVAAQIAKLQDELRGIDAWLNEHDTKQES